MTAQPHWPTKEESSQVSKYRKCAYAYKHRRTRLSLVGLCDIVCASTHPLHRSSIPGGATVAFLVENYWFCFSMRHNTVILMSVINVERVINLHNCMRYFQKFPVPNSWLTLTLRASWISPWKYPIHPKMTVILGNFEQAHSLLFAAFGALNSCDVTSGAARILWFWGIIDGVVMSSVTSKYA